MDIEKKSPCRGPYGAKSIKMEIVERDVWYAFSLNMVGESQWLVAYNNYESEIKSLTQASKKMDYVFVPEYSQFGRFHVHGKIRFSKKKDIGHFYAALGDLKCNYELDVISDLEKWDGYMYKQKDVMECMAKYYHKPYEITSTTHRQVEFKM